MKNHRVNGAIDGGLKSILDAARVHENLEGLNTSEDAEVKPARVEAFRLCDTSAHL